MCEFKQLFSSEAGRTGQSFSHDHIHRIKSTGYNILIFSVVADKVGNVVPLLQALPQQTAVGQLIRKVHCGNFGRDLIGKDCHIQTIKALLQHSGFQPLNHTNKDMFESRLDKKDQ